MGPQQGGTALCHGVQPHIDGLIGIVVSPVGLIHQRPYDLTGQRHQRRDAVGQRCPRHAVEVGKAHPHSALLRQILGDLLRQRLSIHLCFLLFQNVRSRLIAGTDLFAHRQH